MAVRVLVIIAVSRAISGMYVIYFSDFDLVNVECYKINLISIEDL